MRTVAEKVCMIKILHDGNFQLGRNFCSLFDDFSQDINPLCNCAACIFFLLKLDEKSHYNGT